MRKIGPGLLVALLVGATFAEIRLVGGLDTRGAFQACVVPASFLAAGALGLRLRAHRVVVALVSALGLLHLLALGLSAVVLSAPGGAAAGGLNVASQVLYASGFAALVLLAAGYPGRRVDPGAVTTVAPIAVAVALPVLAGLAGATPTVLQPDGPLLQVRPVAELLPAGVAGAGALVLALPLAAALVFAARYRRADARTRRRMRWPMLGTALIGLLAVVAVFLGSSLPPSAEAVFLVAVPLLPVCIVLGATAVPPADVDVWLRRGAVFGGTWAVAAAAYGIGISAAAWAAGGRALAATVVVGGVLSVMLATPVRRRLLALADERSRLQSDLAEQVDLLTARSAELADSRRRLATATEAERMRIERDLHDGVQQEILAVIAQVEAARSGLRDTPLPPGAALALAQAGELARAAYETVRAVATGVRPPVLDDLGLVDAIRARATGSPVPVQVVAAEHVSALRWPAEVEGAAYFFVQEALANVLKHSAATRAVVELSAAGGALVVDVRDDGRGGLNPAGGTGLAGLRDRVEALGGTMTLAEADDWTHVGARFPAEGLPR